MSDFNGKIHQLYIYSAPPDLLVNKRNTYKYNCVVGKQRACMLSMSRLNIKCQAQIRSLLFDLDPTKIHHSVKLHQNLTSYEQFSYPEIWKRLSRSKVKVKCHQHLITSGLQKHTVEIYIRKLG